MNEREAESIWVNALMKYRDRYCNEVLSPTIQGLIEDAHSKGILPLVPLTWGMRDIWYVGDLT
mgnify:CR=1 FL=1